MSNLSKAELEELNKELKAKLKQANEELKELKKPVKVDEMPSQSVGLHKDEKGRYHLVKVNFDLENNAAVIEGTTDLNTNDATIAVFQSKKYLVEKIVLKVTGSKYAK